MTTTLSSLAETPCLAADILESPSSPPPRFLRLPNPRTGLPSLYLPHTPNEGGKLGVLEVQSINPDEERSWFFGETVVAGERFLPYSLRCRRHQKS
jgi:hypothetical protein